MEVSGQIISKWNRPGGVQGRRGRYREAKARPRPGPELGIGDRTQICKQVRKGDSGSAIFVSRGMTDVVERRTVKTSTTQEYEGRQEKKTYRVGD